MAQAVLLVETRPVSTERAEEFNEWYDTVHIPEIIAKVPGFIGARRYLTSPASPTQPEQPYLAIYEIEADDPDAVLREMQRAVAERELAQTTSLSRDPAPTITLYVSI